MCCSWLNPKTLALSWDGVGKGFPGGVARPTQANLLISSVSYMGSQLTSVLTLVFNLCLGLG